MNLLSNENQEHLLSPMVNVLFPCILIAKNMNLHFFLPRPREDHMRRHALSFGFIYNLQALVRVSFRRDLLGNVQY